MADERCQQDAGSWNPGHPDASGPQTRAWLKAPSRPWGPPQPRVAGPSATWPRASQDIWPKNVRHGGKPEEEGPTEKRGRTTVYTRTLRHAPGPVPVCMPGCCPQEQPREVLSGGPSPSGKSPQTLASEDLPGNSPVPAAPPQQGLLPRRTHGRAILRKSQLSKKHFQK